MQNSLKNRMEKKLIDTSSDDDYTYLIDDPDIFNNNSNNSAEKSNDVEMIENVEMKRPKKGDIVYNITSLKNKRVLTNVLCTYSIEKLCELEKIMEDTKKNYDEYIKKNPDKDNLQGHPEITKYDRILIALTELKTIPIITEINLEKNSSILVEITEVINNNLEVDPNNFHNKIIDVEKKMSSLPLLMSDIRARFYNGLIVTGMLKSEICKIFEISVRQINNYLQFLRFISKYPYIVRLQFSFTFIVENIKIFNAIINKDQDLKDICKNIIYIR